MYDSYNYPPGADTPDAPWNKVEIPEIEVNCDTCVTLRKDITIMTDDYEEKRDGEDYDITLTLSYQDAEEQIHQQHYSLTELLEELARRINVELADENIEWQHKANLKNMLDDCQGWTEDYFQIEEYSTK